MKTIKTDPGAKRLMESLRSMGYDCSTAIADLVDNSITAGASEIDIDIIAKQEAHQDTIPQKEYHPAAIVIADNGKGMDRDQLHEAMRFGTLQEYSLRDLGRYGLGLKTASLSQCRILTVSSKAKSADGTRPRKHCMRWDVDHIYETNDWELLIPEGSELAVWEKKVLDNPVAEDGGTVVLWTNLDGALSALSSNIASERERLLAHLIEEVGVHLRMVFHRFMQGSVTGRRKLNITLCGTPLVPWDPFCRSEKTQELDILPLRVILTEPNGSKIEESVTISPYILPREDEFSSRTAWTDASGPKNWNLQQGFYFYRNERLLQSGGWSHLRTSDEHTKLLRIAVDFSGELDSAFNINVTKMRANIPHEIRDEIKSNVGDWIKIAKARYKSPSSTNTNILTNSTGIILPYPNNTSNILDTNSNKDQEPNILNTITKHEGQWKIQDFCQTVVNLLSQVYQRKVDPDDIPMDTIQKIYKEVS